MNDLSLPLELRRQFEALERRLWRIDAAVAICGAAGALLLSCGMQFVSDRLWDTPGWLRAFFTLLGFGFLVCFFFGYARRWVWGRRGFESLAALVQKRYRRLGDRLLGIVELADAARRPQNVSPELCEAAIGQVAAEAARIDFREAASAKKSHRYGKLLALLLAAAAVPCLVAPQASLNALKRWLWPGARVERYTFVRLGDLPAHRVVARGEPFEIACSVDDNWLWRPSWAWCRFENQPAIESPIVAGRIVFSVPGQTQSGFLTLRAGDVSKRIFMESVYRPELARLTARTELPAYLGYPPVEEKIEGDSFTVLRGSRVSLEGTATRALQSAEVRIANGGLNAPLEIEGSRFRSAPLVLDGFALCSLHWKDVLGLDAPAPAIFKLQTKEDVAPEVECPGLAEAVAVLQDEVVHIPIAAKDDYGLRDMGLQWEVATRAGVKAPVPEETRVVQKGGAQVRALKGGFDFSPLLLRIPEDSTVTLRALASDYFPGRAPSESASYRIYVLSKEAHARLVKEQFDKLAGELEELTRKQEALMDAGKQVRDKPEPDSARKLSDQSTEQKENADELKDIAKEMAATVREGLRNGDLPENLLQDYAKQAGTMNGLAQNEMPEAAGSLASAQLPKALAQEEKILEALRGLQEKGAKAADKMSGAVIALRLRKIASAEKRIAATFRQMLPETVGMRPGEMPGEQRRMVEQMAAGEETARGDSSAIEDEIARFFDRTRVTAYGEVANDMGAAGIDENLGRLAQLAGANTSVASIEGALEWAGRFDKWAERLENSSGAKSGAPSDSQPMSELELKALLALIRIREQEASLRDQTVAIDKSGDGGLSPRALATTQQEIHEAVRRLQGRADFPVRPRQLEPARRAMADAGALLEKSITGDATVASQTDAINILDYLINGNGNGGGSSAGLAMLRELMRMTGNGGAGSMAGGMTDRANERVSGSRTGAPEAPRAVSTTGGKEVRSFPVEFRDALESYYGAIEHGE